MTKTPEEIAASLNDAQRRAIATRWCDHPTLVSAGIADLWYSFVKESGFFLIGLTSLGKQVQAHLTKEPRHD